MFGNVKVDYILPDGKAQGGFAQMLLNNGATGGAFDVGPFRPFIWKDGRTYITVNSIDRTTGLLKQTTVPVNNANGTLFYDEWKVMDTAVTKASLTPLQAWADLRAANSRTVPNGMGTTVMQYQNRIGQQVATISMDGDRDAERDRPVTEIRNLPLPIIHADFWFSQRELATSRNFSMPLDTSGGEDAARAVSEEAEKLTIGTGSSYTYGGGTIYGYINFPQRNTKTITLPTDSSWTPKTLTGELLAMIKQAKDDNFYGPYALYFSPGWDPYLDDDYSDVKGSDTLRQRLGAIRNISRIDTLQYLPDHQVILVQMQANVARAVVGMDLTTLQYETNGGMRQNWKVMAIYVPNLRYDTHPNGNIQCGIVHATAA